MPTMPPKDIDVALKAINANMSAYNTYIAYMDGNQRLSFATPKFSNAFGSLFREFADNLCPGIIDAVADRLIVTGFAVEGEESAQEGDAADVAWQIWQANRMDQRSGEAHQSALVEGDNYVIVWPSAENSPTIYVNDARSMYIRYDEEEPGKVLWAAKAWVTGDKYKRVNLYYTDRIEKYRSRNPGPDYTLPSSDKTLEPYQPEGEAWPLPNPYNRVPVFHFANNAPPGRFGVSELKHIIPVQDALNKTTMDMLVAMEFLAFPQRWATGIEIPTNPVTGEPVQPFNPAIDRLWATSGENAKFGSMEGADLTNFLKVGDNFRLEIARISGTPLHYMSLVTDPPSGEALKTLEARFVKKVKDRQTSYGNVWEDVLSFAVFMQTGQEARLSCQWVDAAPVSTKELYETADMALNRAGLDKEYVWSSILDLPEAEIAAMLKRAEERKAADLKEAEQTMKMRAEAFGTVPQPPALVSQNGNGKLPQ